MYLWLIGDKEIITIECGDDWRRLVPWVDLNSFDDVLR